MLRLDHIAIAATSLDQGVAYVEETLGVPMVGGGKHDAMGTHNRLLGLAEGLYLEVIAVDPKAQAPSHARWFDLDNFSGAPRLTNWIVASTDILPLLQSHTSFGRPLNLQRGALTWTMAVPNDGKLPLDGAHPAVLEWQAGGHPAEQLSVSGCGLKKLIVRHPRIDDLIAMLPPFFGPKLVFETGESGLIAHIDTPKGTRILT